MSKPELRIAVVGAGILGRRHARVFHEMDGVTLAAVVSRTRERAEALAGDHGVTAYTDLSALLADGSCDAVAIATPDHLHAEAVLAALAAGVHVLVEKPLATTLPEARAMVAAAEGRGLVLQVNYSQRRVPEFEWIRDQVAAGVVGTPVMIQSSKQDTIFVPTRMISWAAHTSPIFFMTSHDLDLVAHFLGARAVSVTAREQRGVLEARGIATHDGVDALVTYDTGATASFHSSWIHPETWPLLVTERMTIIGEEGVIHFENQGRRVECFSPAGGKTLTFSGPQTATEVDGRIKGAFTATLEEFRDCILSGTQPATSAASTLHVTATQVAILDAVRSGRAEDVA
ncbi:MAG TPA: Gfo/Idh/MocA family oxidoreductase [Longimicrobiales bacterium]|nr:Gfo/Idh/MocA family oxidoreductase [Longimicrobiales bacterium]